MKRDKTTEVVHLMTCSKCGPAPAAHTIESQAQRLAEVHGNGEHSTSVETMMQSEAEARRQAWKNANKRSMVV